jgi:hypothetical protein
MMRIVANFSILYLLSLCVAAALASSLAKSAREYTPDPFEMLDCGPFERMVQFDQYTRTERDALFYQLRASNGYMCFRDINGRTRFFGIPPKTFNQVTQQMPLMLLPDSFNDWKTRNARGDTCDFMSFNDYKDVFQPYIDFLRAFGANDAASKLSQHLQMVHNNKNMVYHFDGRRQLGGPDNVCVDLMLTPMYTSYVLKTLHDHFTSRGKANVLSLLGISRQSSNDQPIIEKKAPGNGNLSLGRDTLPTASRELFLSEAQLIEKFKNCHAICKKMLRSEGYHWKGASLSTCCAQCRGPDCALDRNFVRLLYWSTVVDVDPASPHQRRLLRLDE